MFKYLAMSILGAMATVSVYTLGPLVEGRYFPVTDNFSVTRMESVGPTTTRVWGEFRRIRGDCTYEDLTWYLGTPEASSAAPPVIFESGTVLREEGWEDFGPWIVQIPLSQIPNSYLSVEHDCHPLWNTRTILVLNEGNVNAG